MKQGRESEVTERPEGSAMQGGENASKRGDEGREDEKTKESKEAESKKARRRKGALRRREGGEEAKRRGA